MSFIKFLHTNLISFIRLFLSVYRMENVYGFFLFSLLFFSGGLNYAKAAREKIVWEHVKESREMAKRNKKFELRLGLTINKYIIFAL